MIRFILFLSLVGLSLNVSAQDYYSKIFDFGLTGGNDWFKAMIEKDNNLYLLTSYQYFDSNNEVEFGIKVLKMDLLGNILNEQTFPWMREQANYGMNMLIEDDFLYILNSYSYPFSNNKNPINLLRLNLQLDSLTIKEYDPLINNPLKSAEASLTSFKDHFIATGWRDGDSNPQGGGIPFIMWINKSDLSLDTVYTFPTNMLEPDSLVRAQMLYSFSNTENTELYVFTELFTRNPFELFDRQEVGFLKYFDRDNITVDYIVDSLGNYSQGNENTPFLTSTGKLFYEKWRLFDVNAYILMDSNGEIIWEKLDTPDNPYGRRYISKFMETSDGNIIGCGRANWHFEYGQSDPDTITTFASSYLIKFDVETGEILWERFIIDYDEDGEVAGNYFANVVEADNGDLICAGYRLNNLANLSLLSSDSWLVRLDEYGCNPDLSCDDLSFLSSTDNIAYTQKSVLNIFPNPVKNKLHVELPVGSTDGRLIIRNTEGSLCMQQDISSLSNVYTLDMSSYTSGIYFIEYMPKDNIERRVFTAKVVVE